MASAVTKGLFDTNLFDFLFAGWLYQAKPSSISSSYEIALSELFNWGNQTNMGISSNIEGGLGRVIKRNIRLRGPQAVVMIVGIPIAFNIAKKLLRKPVLTPANRLLKQVGFTGVKL